MNVKQIFDSNFVSTVQALLDEKCVNGGAVTRSDLCKHLDLSAPDTGNTKKNEQHALVLEGVVGSLITLAIIGGFESRKGPGGGIGRIGEKRVAGPKEKGSASVKEVTYPDGFLTKLEGALNTMCSNQGCRRRKDIASTMGMAGSDTEALISAAIRDLSGLGAQYESQRGVNGGIRRRLVALTPSTEVAPEIVTDDVTEETHTELSDEALLLAPETSVFEGPELADAPVVDAPVVASANDVSTAKPANAKKNSKKSGGSKKNNKKGSSPAAA